MKLIQRVITFGDSFTYGQELQNPEKSSWPSLLASYLEVPLVNTAQPGNSNDFMQEQILRQNYTFYDLVIVCFSSITRFYFEDHQGWFTTIPDVNNEWPARDKFTKHFLGHTSEEWMYRRWLTQLVYIQEYLRFKHVKYFFANAFTNEDFRNFNKIKSNKVILDQLDSSKFIGWPDSSFNSMTVHLPRGPFLHPLEESHQLFADVIKRQLRIVYDAPKEI